MEELKFVKATPSQEHLFIHCQNIFLEHPEDNLSTMTSPLNSFTVRGPKLSKILGLKDIEVALAEYFLFILRETILGKTPSDSLLSEVKPWSHTNQFETSFRFDYYLFDILAVSVGFRINNDNSFSILGQNFSKDLENKVVYEETLFPQFLEEQMNTLIQFLSSSEVFLKKCRDA